MTHAKSKLSISALFAGTVEGRGGEELETALSTAHSLSLGLDVPREDLLSPHKSSSTPRVDVRGREGVWEDPQAASTKKPLLHMPFTSLEALVVYSE